MASSPPPPSTTTAHSLCSEHNHTRDTAIISNDEWRLTSNSFKQRQQYAPHLPTPETSAAESCLGCRSCFKACGFGNAVDDYYRRQNETLKEFARLDSLLQTDNLSLTVREEDAQLEASAKAETTAIQVSNVSNLVLFVAKIFVSVLSGSLAIIASTLDSLLDILSGFILWFTSFTMKRPNPYLYPIGKQRMQPVGILVFSSVMATLGLQIVIISVQRLVKKEKQLHLDGNKEYMLIGAMIFAIVLKSFLAIYCRAFSNSIVKAYAQDHLFDVITNTLGLIAAILASKYYWWIDPVGALLLALYTISCWSSMALDNVRSLVGKTAPPDFLQKIIYICWNHDRNVVQIDTVRAYTFGSRYFVEVDIVLPDGIPLATSHDIGEALQNKLESLRDVERAFVHVDYEGTHQPEHTRNWMAAPKSRSPEWDKV